MVAEAEMKKFNCWITLVKVFFTGAIIALLTFFGVQLFENTSEFENEDPTYIIKGEIFWMSYYGIQIAIWYAVSLLFLIFFSVLALQNIKKLSGVLTIKGV